MSELRYARERLRALSGHAASWQVRLFLALLVLYAVVTVCVLVPGSPALALDRWILGAKLRHDPTLVHQLNDYVVLGQRKPAIRVFFPFFVWVALRKRSVTPLLLLTLSLLLLNASVGVVKLATGRLGPRATSNVHDLFHAGGDIYPSGHVSNAVVLFGMMAYLALRFRRAMTAIAIALSVSIGVSTLFIGSHWFSDVVGGWLAGALVLLVVHFCAPAVELGKVRTVAWARAGAARVVAVAAVSLFLAGILLSWVYFDIQWSAPLAALAAVVLVALCAPGFGPPLVDRIRRRTSRRGAPVPARAVTPRAAPVPVAAPIAPPPTAPAPIKVTTNGEARRSPIGSRS